jgi:regulator of sigma E protease
MTTALAIAAAVLAVSALIVVHEAGHYWAARRSGMKVERFSIGFGPVVLAFRRGDTEFAISALPLGGYVKISGMSAGDDVDPADPTAYANQPAWRRFLVILAGPLMNYLAAILIAAGMLATMGLLAPDPSSRVGLVAPESPAARAGLAPGDRIVAVDGRPVDTFAQLVEAFRSRPGRTVPIDVERGDQRLALSITPRDDGGVGKVGLGQAQRLDRRPPAAALPGGIERTNRQAGQQLAAFGALFTAREKAELSGPAGIAQALVQGAKAGTQPFLSLVWVISIVLAILNLLPVPALDGGRLVFLLVEIVTRRRVNERVENAVHFAGFVALLALILAVTVFGDLPRLLGR